MIYMKNTYRVRKGVEGREGGTEWGRIKEEKEGERKEGRKEKKENKCLDK